MRPKKSFRRGDLVRVLNGHELSTTTYQVFDLEWSDTPGDPHPEQWVYRLGYWDSARGEMRFRWYPENMVAFL